MKFRVVRVGVGVWDASVTVVDVEAPNRSLTLTVPTHEVLTEEALAEAVRKAVDQDRESVANLDMLFEAHRTGRVLDA